MSIKRSETSPQTTDVLISGAGPSGLMLGMCLARYGVKSLILDDRADKTSTGRADGLQPKTLETLKQLRIADSLLARGVKIYDISFWNSIANNDSLKRTRREIHFPKSTVDVLEPYILLVHQGMVEDIFINDLASHNINVQRNSVFQSYTTFNCNESGNENKSNSIDRNVYPIKAVYKDTVTNKLKLIYAKYLVGSDGAHSNVRKSMVPKSEMKGESSDSFWGVLDGTIETNFPDLWFKCAINSNKGTILCIPRERNMTRLYIELPYDKSQKNLPSATTTTQEYVIQRAKEIFAPKYNVSWKNIEWFGVYRVGQRVAENFIDGNGKVFIIGDAGHTHSPKAAQGMNVSVHDSWNLAWKLALVLKGNAHPDTLLSTYATERQKIAQDLIDFDYEHAKAFCAGDAAALAVNFSKNINFIAGVGADYNLNILNIPSKNLVHFGQSSFNQLGKACPGKQLPICRATRFIDSNPIDVQIDIPMLCQFRIYFLVSDFIHKKSWMNDLSKNILSSTGSIFTKLLHGEKDSKNTEYSVTPVEMDEFIQPNRYIPQTDLLTLCMVTTSKQESFEFTDLPKLLLPYEWTIYLDNTEVPVHKKWLGENYNEEATGIVIVRPDGYVGAVDMFLQVDEASKWIDNYFKGFLI